MANQRLGTLSNLPSGATYDILLIKFPDGFPQSQLKFDIDDTPKKITGIQKVAQMFLKVLFTTAGSNVLLPNQGTNFSQLTINSNVSADDNIFTAELTSEISLAEGQTKAILNSVGSDPASQLESINVLGLDTGDEGAIIYLRLITRAGAVAQVAVPFPQLNMSLTGD